MKDELGRCLLQERLDESGMNKEDLARVLKYKPEKLQDFMDNKRVMSLKAAIHIADAIGCDVKQLYEWKPIQ
ncbi:helix-turn-helix domain-containing protein [Paenibacillus sedimenti]|uniref:Helix-turn-helix transcriptional regulator n=1 Tax=Paenibacillus sedimenti TaxID=2770274 RepID=A0A926KTM4_9BACL|nr:helix-turn-helix domain-containing protein [Paenibacillus sedimenti]MBD0383073.1 helix-turn-helix transcriptional regulator [Paenibacillus sedimenti]